MSPPANVRIPHVSSTTVDSVGRPVAAKNSHGTIVARSGQPSKGRRSWKQFKHADPNHPDSNRCGGRGGSRSCLLTGIEQPRDIQGFILPGLDGEGLSLVDFVFVFGFGDYCYSCLQETMCMLLGPSRMSLADL